MQGFQWPDQIIGTLVVLGLGCLWLYGLYLVCTDAGPDFKDNPQNDSIQEPWNYP